MALKPDVQTRSEAQVSRLYEMGLAKLKALGIVQSVPREMQQREAEAMRADPAQITAKVAELARTMPVERAQLQVAQQLLKFGKPQEAE